MKQKEINSILRVKSEINSEEEIRRIVMFIKKYLQKHITIRSLIVGISGGQDSTLAGKLCQIAINEIRQKYYKFIAIRLPYGKQRDEKDCQDALKFIQPDIILKINIKRAIQASEATLRNRGILLNDFIKGNEKARERMKIQYSIAGMNAGLVVGSTNASEMLTGFFTKYGDGATDITPLLHLNKRQIRQLLEYLHCPKHLYLKTPTADLEEDRPAFPDEDALGVSYDRIDDYLEGKIIDEKSAQIIENWYKITSHKRQPPIKIGDEF
ncbi:ammonia-dependent NAD(+) synthetase [Candidatus Schneideria nysicola]|uniref:ammonia-dependent NAD(+) synthetase n=1 Tax=Candidatus Schneideria nysicola TaxID=1081631 RepID=UPI001CAA61F2|nr:ammonia-dependent NAD(+) synthetase [Candidatus Schneideria nysicola]UAJ65171.1 ammonia-dependent NAD(+) synthetase [Candidatus Schneideria nysicola]